MSQTTIKKRIKESALVDFVLLLHTTHGDAHLHLCWKHAICACVCVYLSQRVLKMLTGA